MDPPRNIQDSTTKFTTPEPNVSLGVFDEPEPSPNAPDQAVILQRASARKPAPLVPIAETSFADPTEAFGTPRRSPIPTGSPAQPRLAEPTTTNAGAGPSNLPRLASRIEEFDEDDHTGSPNPESDHQLSVHSIHSRSNRGADEDEDRNETHGPTADAGKVRDASIRHSERTSRHPSILSAPPTIDSQYLLLRPLEIWSAQAPLGQDPVKGRSNAMAHNMIASFAGGWTERTVGERIACTLDAAKQGRHKADIRGTIIGHAS